VGDAEILRDRSEAGVGSPKAKALDHGGRQQVDIDPTHSPSVEPVISRERNHL